MENKQQNFKDYYLLKHNKKCRFQKLTPWKYYFFECRVTGTWISINGITHILFFLWEQKWSDQSHSIKSIVYLRLTLSNFTIMM